jgi:hypothetical protein
MGLLRITTALPNHLVRSCQHVGRNRQADLFRCFQIDDELELRRRSQTVFWTIVINLRHHIDHLVAEAFLGCYLDRSDSQLQRLQPRRHSLKVGLLHF